jgi:SAM-dependent methyltransferase
MQHRKEKLIPVGMGIDEHAVLYRTADTIIRAIKPKSTKFYAEILEHPAIIKLMNDGILIPTQRSDIKVEGHDLVLEHPLLPLVSYPFEWTPNMYRDAAITILRLNLELLQAGYCTHDAHLWNVIFDGITPRFVDFTSIIKALPGNRWRAKIQFNNYCLNPLLIMEAGYPTTARSLLREIFCYPDPAIVNTLLNRPVSTSQICDQVRTATHRYSRYWASRLSPDVKNVIKKVLGATKKVSTVFKNSNEDDIFDVRILLHKVESLRLSPKIAQWSEYYSGKNELPIYDGSLDVLNSIKGSTPKHLLVSDILQKIQPRSVLDMGCNRGLYSQIAALQGAQVVGVDLDERALDDMYMDSKRLNTTALPLYINTVAPAEAIGFKEIPFPSVTERLRSELVMSLALVHHLVFKTTKMSFAHIAKLFDSYSEKFLLVEFIPKEDVHIQSWYTDDFDWYNLDNFKLALAEYFPQIEVFESFPSPRVILYCAKLSK